MCQSDKKFTHHKIKCSRVNTSVELITHVTSSTICLLFSPDRVRLREGRDHHHDLRMEN